MAGDSSERDVRHSSIHTQSPLPFWYIVGPSNHWFQDDNQRLKPGPSKIVETPTRGAISDAPCIPQLWKFLKYSGMGLSPKFWLCPSSRALTQVLPFVCLVRFGGSGLKSFSKIDDYGSWEELLDSSSWSLEWRGFEDLPSKEKARTCLCMATKKKGVSIGSLESGPDGSSAWSVGGLDYQQNFCQLVPLPAVPVRQSYRRY